MTQEHKIFQGDDMRSVSYVDLLSGIKDFLKQIADVAYSDHERFTQKPSSDNSEGNEQSDNAHPILSKLAYFQGIDEVINSLPGLNSQERENLEQLTHSMRLEYQKQKELQQSYKSTPTLRPGG